MLLFEERMRKRVAMRNEEGIWAEVERVFAVLFGVLCANEEVVAVTAVVVGERGGVGEIIVSGEDVSGL